MKETEIKNFGLYLDSESGTSDSDFFPLLSKEDELKIENEEIPEVLNILPLRNTVLFPGVIIPITVGRDKSIKLIKDVYKEKKIVGVVTQKDGDVEDPGIDDVYHIGTVAYIIKLLQMPDGNNTVIIQGRNKFEIKEFVQVEPYLQAKVTPVKQIPSAIIEEDNYNA